MGWTVRDQIPVGARFFMQCMPASWSAQPQVEWVTCPSRGEGGRSVLRTTDLLLVPGYELVGAIPPPPLCAGIGILWGDLRFIKYIIHLQKVTNNHTDANIIM